MSSYHTTRIVPLKFLIGGDYTCNWRCEVIYVVIRDDGVNRKCEEATSAQYAQFRARVQRHVHGAQYHAQTGLIGKHHLRLPPRR